ncbi:hypothetical protein NMR34_003420 [Vibrio cholerae]|nr:hypothetical protein [Vibrio cholerae]
MSDKQPPTDNYVHYDVPIIGNPSKEDIFRAINDDLFRSKLCNRYGAAKIEQMIDKALAERP